MSLEKKISSALEEILSQNKIEGDILVFLAGMRDILTAQTYLQRVYGDQFEYQILHGDLTIEEQLKIFTPSMKAKKIILSTNIAESSVTIPSVRIVIDNGEYREIEISPWTGLKTLKTKRISKASAIQRAGRAQRTGPGICFRLMSEFDYKAMNEINRPEILREDLSSAYLWAKGLKLEPKWVTTPTPAQIEQAHKILFLLGSIQKNGQITDIGIEILNLPLHPRAARILIESFAATELVQREIIKTLAKWLEGDQPQRMETRLKKIIQDNKKNNKNPIESIEQCFICGLYDQVIKKRNDFEYIHQSGQVLKARFQTSGKWFLSLEIDHLSNIQNLMELPEEWYLELPKDFLQENIQVNFVSETQRLERLYQLKFNNLVIEESKRQILPANESSLVQEQIISEALKVLQNNLKTFFESEDYQKIKLLINHQGINDNEETFNKLLITFTKENLLKNEQIKLTDFFEDFKNDIYQHLGLSYKEKIQEYFPSRLKLTNGREVKLDYSTHPHIYGEALLQDFYGIKTHPALFDSKIKITLRLLGPHKRPIQVTSDLITFWKGSYQMVKKEMQSEYPRHHWSDDPVNAEPILLKKNLVKD
jgi:ATP-dependent helicase HrpB